MSTATIPERLLYPLGEFAQLIGVSRSKLYRLMDRKELAFVLVGCERRIPASELTRIFKEGLAPTPVAAPKRPGKSSLV